MASLEAKKREVEEFKKLQRGLKEEARRKQRAFESILDGASEEENAIIQEWCDHTNKNLRRLRRYY